MRRLSESRLAFLAPLLRPIHQRLPPVNFITIHYAYFIATCLLAAIIFWGSSTPARSVSFTDSLFLAVSAMTLAGLNTVNLSTLNTFQQFILFILIMMGSAIFVSAFTVHVRRKAFERKFASIVRDRKDRLGNHGLSLQTLPFTRSFSRSRTMERSSTEAPSRRSLRHVSSNRQDGIKVQPTDARDSPERPMDSKGELSSAHDQSGESAIDDVVEASPTRAITFSANTHFRRPSDDHEGPRRRRRMSMLSMSGVGAVSGSGFDNISLHRSQTGRSNEDNASMHSHQQATHHYFPSSGFISRNSQFHGLTEEERERLGGVEYGAIHWLSWLVPIYFVLWQLIACIGCAAYVAINRPSTARTNGLDPWWVGAFNAVSAFNNSGMSLLDANMTAYQTSYYMLITMSLLILAGNTCYPIFLRLIIWVIMKLMPDDETWKEQRSTLRFLLDHPRRCYTNLFPSQHTWWLLFAVISLNAVDWAAFEILNIGNTKLTSGLPTNIRVIDGLFQAFAVRSGGFYVVSIPSLRISLQVLYVVSLCFSLERLRTQLTRPGHDVRLGLPCGHHYAQLERIRRTQSRHLLRRPQFRRLREPATTRAAIILARSHGSQTVSDPKTGRAIDLRPTAAARPARSRLMVDLSCRLPDHDHRIQPIRA